MSTGDVARLEAMLVAAGLDASVEGRAALALVVPRGSLSAITPASRRWLVEAAQACGFTHVAVELTATDDHDAPLPRGHAA